MLLSAPPSRRFLAIARLSCVALAAGCADGSRQIPASSAHHPAWSYAGENGPEHWADRDPSFALCSRGKEQSPIDLPHPPSDPKAPSITFHWDRVPLTLVNNGHAIQVDDAAPSSLVLDGVTYSLAQFHLHVPAEHTLEGRTFDAEMHLVHRAPDGKLAVIALFFRSGAENAPLRPLFDAIPMESGAPRTIAGQTIDVGALVPRAAHFLSYAGSLTTPPCTEGVHWLVALPDSAPLELAPADLAKLRAAVHAPTNRPTQPRNGRSVDLGAL